MTFRLIRRALVCACVVLLTCAAAHGAGFKEAKFGPASLTIVEGVPVVHVYGTPEQMGEQQGKLLGEQAKAAHTQYLGKLFFPGGKDVGLRAGVLKVALRMQDSIPAIYIREMKAFAKASGMSYENVLLSNTVFDIKRAIFCTTFVATGERSADGKPVFGRNLDFPTLGVAHTFSCVVVYHPNDGHAVASITFPGLIGVLSGLSDAGVAAAVMEVHLQGSQVQATPYGMVFRSALTECNTTDAVIKAVSARARTATNNLMICDALGNAACLELGMKKSAVRRPEAGLVYATNHFRSDELGHPWPCWRIPKLKKVAQDGRKLDEAAAQKILQSVSYKLLTMQSMVFRPASREFLLAIGKPPASKRKFVRLTSGVLFPKRKDQ